MALFFGRSTLSRKWGANIGKIDFFPGVCDLAPKARKVFFTKVRCQRAHFFCISPPPGHLCGPYFKDTARTKNENPTVLFSQRYKPHLANWQKKMCLDSTFFRYRADFLRTITYGNAQKYLRIHFLFLVFIFGVFSTRKGSLVFKRLAYSADLNERRSRIGKKIGKKF